MVVEWKMVKHVVIIGAGQIAERVHVPYYKEIEDKVKVVAVVDPFLDRAQAFAENNGITNYYTTITDMLLNERIDLASVCTPNRFHFEATMQLLSAGIHVFCEKPPAMTALEAKIMYEKSKEMGVILAFDFQYRFSDEAQRLKREIECLGDIYYIEAQALRRSGVPGWGNFIDKNLQGGGPLIDLGIHMLETTLFLLDYPQIKKVQAYSFQKIGPYKSEGSFGKWEPTKYTVEDALFGTIEFTNGSILRLNTSFALHIKEESIYNIQLCGSNAGATLYPLEIYTDVKGKLRILSKMPLSSTNKHKKSMEAFISSVFDGVTEHLVTAKQGYYIQKVIELLYKSAENGESIDYEDYQ